nr:MAG TPA: hypothetical protein [Caudoviricetes sp.]
MTFIDLRSIDYQKRLTCDMIRMQQSKREDRGTKPLPSFSFPGGAA